MDDRTDTSVEQATPEATRAETLGRVLFLLGGGVLLSVLVSCACGPTR